MKMAFRLVLLAAFLFPGPEKIVRKRLAQVAAEASFKSGENPLIIAARSEALAGFFSTNVEINVSLPEHGPLNLTGRAEITQAAAGARAAAGSLRVEFQRARSN